MMKMFSASRVNDTTAKMSQQEIVFPVRPDSNIVPERERNGPNAIPHERNKGTFIGGGHSFTDMPPNEYGIMSKGNETVVEIFGILMTFSFFLYFFYSQQVEALSNNLLHKCHNPGFHKYSMHIIIKDT